ncbi:ArsR/SmtB family transcription factor [Peptostreptococcus faecalis]|uniref:ArsR/SmtB family transcription factor n=1 Tax=Peptostreptococcus faecalis TaxID=2045015 RepID=UPI000C7B59CD|nr:metalloregulator ArsR/SmtB family transcription factor [Peptostreptococcus faecalis]
MPIEKMIIDDEIQICQEHKISIDKNSLASDENISDEKIDDLAEFFKVFGDVTRIKIIKVLFDKELCVCEIADLIGMTQSAISHQLRTLKKARLVKFRKEGKTVYYSLDDSHVRDIFDCGLSHINEMYY